MRSTNFYPRRSLPQLLLRVLGWALLVVSPAAAEPMQLEVARPDGSRIRAYLDTPEKSATSYPLMLICQGSEAVSAYPKFASLIEYLNQRGVAALRVEKRGMQAGPGPVPEEYLRHNSISGRVLDAMEILSELERNQPAWNGRLALLGGSEGGEVAAQIAALQPVSRLRALTLLVSGNTATFQDELLESGLVPREALLKQAEKMHQEPLWSKEWASDGKTVRNTYRWWAEALPVQIGISLDKLRCPIWIVHGDRDPITPPAAGTRLQHRYAGKDFRYTRVPGCDHDILANESGRRTLEETLRWSVSRLRDE